MDSAPPGSHARHRPSAGRPPFQRIALVLQGGGALGAYQGGVYQALAEAGIHPDWVAGISIGAINAALIAGNRPEQRVEKLRRFWETVTESPIGAPTFNLPLDPTTHRAINQARAASIAMFGAPGFFTPRFPSPAIFPPASVTDLGLYDVSPLRGTLNSLIDWHLLNSGATRLSVGAVNVQTGNFLYFDTPTRQVGVEHIMASGALPPGFPAVEIEGEFYWDGGVVSNTPLDWILESPERQDTLVFQVDLWNARGPVPRNLAEADLRQKEIRFSSRTRLSTDRFRRNQCLRHALARLMQDLPPDLLQSPHAEMLAREADPRAYNIIQLICRAESYEGTTKDYEFSRRTMEEHWTGGYNDTIRTLRHPEVLRPSPDGDGVFTFDIARDGRL